MQFFQALSDQRTSSDGATLHPSPLRKDKTVTPGMSTKPRGDGRRTDGRADDGLSLASERLARRCSATLTKSRSFPVRRKKRIILGGNFAPTKADVPQAAREGREDVGGGEAETEMCKEDRQACSSRDPFQDYFLHQEWNSRLGPSEVVA